MAHYDTLVFPLGVAKGAESRVKRRTIRVESASGHVIVNQLWSAPLRTFDAGALIRTITQAQTLVSFWEEARGNLHSFLMLDPGDCTSAAGNASPTKDDQAIGTGDNAETAFQLVKAYGSTNAYTRTILKPKNGTVLIALDGVLQTETTHYTVNYATGVVTFVTPPGSSVAVTAGFEFYTPARFALPDDVLPMEIVEFRGGGFASVPLEEVRL